MDAATLAVIVVSITTAKICALLGLWLRLRWRTQHEQAQRQYLADVTALVTADRHLEFHEQRGTGHRLRMRLSSSRIDGKG